MRLAEIFGPSGAGKSSIYDEVVKLGGVTKNPAFSVKQSWEILGQSDSEFVSRCAAYLNHLFVADKERYDALTPKDKARACGVYRALAKHALALASTKSNRHMVVDGGLIHLATSIDRMGFDYARYVRKIPFPSIGIKVNIPKDALIQRLTERNGECDVEDVEKSIKIADDAAEIILNRGGSILELDAMNSVEENAAHVHSVLCRGETRKFHGALAATYDSKREKQDRWQAEQKIIEGMLSDLPEDSYVLDCPVGTGRFIPFFEDKRFIWTGVDKSEDMLKQASEKGKQHNAAKIRSRLVSGDILDLPFEDDSYDAALMIRMTRWLNHEERDRALREMQRISRGRVIFTARVDGAGVTKHPYPYEDIRKSLYDNWEIHRDEAASEENYRVIELRRKA